MTTPPKTLLIACGALAREMLALIEANRWGHMTLECLPAKLHNRPEKIPDAVREKIAGARGRFAQILVAYADCGTGGLLDKVLAEEGVERIGGPHCYSFYAGENAFETLHEEELGTLYLTDYLVRHFDTLIIIVNEHQLCLRRIFSCICFTGRTFECSNFYIAIISSIFLCVNK